MDSALKLTACTYSTVYALKDSQQTPFFVRYVKTYAAYQNHYFCFPSSFPRWYKHRKANEPFELTERDGEENRYRLTESSTEFSFSQTLAFLNVSLVDRGRYYCKVQPKKHHPSVVNEHHTVSSYYMDAAYR